MTVEMLTALGGVVVAILTPIFAMMKFILKEFKPNGGSSIKDQINRLDHRIDEIYQLLVNKGDK